jgi:hypothetical protein
LNPSKETRMATDDVGSPVKSGKKSKKHEKAKKKRKRERSSKKTKMLESSNQNDIKEDKESGLMDVVDSSPKASIIRSPDKTRGNPFKMSSPNSPRLTFSSPNENGVMDTMITPPPQQSPLSTPVKRVVQFKDSDDSDDGDYSPKTKRKKLFTRTSTGLNLNNPLSPKSAHISPKKISTKEKLLDRKRELELERKKLPIWSGNSVYWKSHSINSS